VNSSAPAVIIIGLDGATFDLLGPWVDEGLLPNIAALLGSGASGRLRSTHPPLTPVAWSSFLTGAGPGKHGIYAFMRFAEDYSPSFLNGGALTIPTFLDLLSEAGARVGALNVPWTWPPPEVNGFCLSGLDAPAYGPDIAHPRGLFEEVAAQIGGYFDKFVPPAKRGYALDRLDQQIEGCGAASRYLLAAHPVDVFAVVFGSGDHVQHWFWRERAVVGRDGRRVGDLLLYVYRKLDEEIGRIVSECAGDRTVVMLMSDHGAGPCEGGINLDNWLASHGWLEPALDAGGWGRRARRSLIRAGGKLVPRALRRRFGGRLALARRKLVSEFASSRIHWPGTRAFSWSDYGNISLNMRGRFESGTVGEHERDALLTEIEDALVALRHPQTGERIMSAPLRGEDIYHGERTDAAPDLLAVVRDYRYEILSNLTPAGPLPGSEEAAIFTPPRREGTHRLHGVFCASGPGVRGGYPLAGLRIEDVAPTVLHLVGLAAPSWMDGRVISAMLTREDLETRPPARREVPLVDGEARGDYDGGQREQVERTLRGLGYI
jgi:predicted AlkP superfamily phosphohydrolase/phosphomutase